MCKFFWQSLHFLFEYPQQALRLENERDPFIRISAHNSALLQQSLLSKVVSSFFVSEAKDTPFTSN